MPLTKPEDFVPSVVLSPEHAPSRAYGTMLVALCKCGGCGRWMVEPLSTYNPFPSYYLASFSAQVKAAGWAVNSYATKSVGPVEVQICAACKAADVGNFTCALCGEARRSSEVQETFGVEDTEYLCKPCYGMVPAKAWDERCEALEKAHRHDGR